MVNGDSSVLFNSFRLYQLAPSESSPSASFFKVFSFVSAVYKMPM